MVTAVITPERARASAGEMPVKFKRYLKWLCNGHYNSEAFGGCRNESETATGTQKLLKKRWNFQKSLGIRRTAF